MKDFEVQKMETVTEKWPEIYNYLDFRAYLKDLFDYNKANKSFFSYRYLSAKSGFSSSNYINLVIKGKRKLSNSGIAKIAKGFALNDNEREYFEYLVLMNQASNHDEKNYYYKKMTLTKGFSKCNRIERDSYVFFSKWYYPVVREVMTFSPANFSSSQIASLLNPPISNKEAKEAIKLLKDLKMIRKNAEGKWVKSHSLLNTGPEVTSLLIANFHKEMMKIASESIERFPAKQRDISGVLLNISSETMDEIKKEINDFREKLAKLSLKNKEANQAIYIGLHAFPVTKKV